MIKREKGREWRTPKMIECERNWQGEKTPRWQRQTKAGFTIYQGHEILEILYSKHITVKYKSSQTVF